jgi:hypothetical protein
LPDTSPLISPRLRQTICSVDHEGAWGKDRYAAMCSC